MACAGGLALLLLVVSATSSRAQNTGLASRGMYGGGGGEGGMMHEAVARAAKMGGSRGMPAPMMAPAFAASPERMMVQDAMMEDAPAGSMQGGGLSGVVNTMMQQRTGGGQNEVPAEPLILKNGGMTLQATNVSVAAGEVAAAARRLGGLVESSAVYDNGPWSSSAEVALRVPDAKFERLMEDIKAVVTAAGGRVLSDNTAARDATAEYVDATARERVARASLAQMEVLMTAAKNVGEVLAIKHEMDAITERIEAAAAHSKYLQSAAAMSSLHVSLRSPPQPYVPPPPPPEPPGWSVGRSLGAALASLAATLQGAIDVAIYTLVFALPLLAVAALAVFVVTSCVPGGAAGATSQFMAAFSAASGRGSVGGGAGGGGSGAGGSAAATHDA